MKFKSILLIVNLSFLITACQMINPIFVDYNGVRMDVAKWINQQPLLTMQQKRSLAQLSKAQQRFYQLEQADEAQKFEINKQNAIALHCAHLHVSESKIEKLQQQIFSEESAHYLQMAQQLPKLKLDEKQIQCE